jgi:Tfp pilus assembly protein PilO
MKSIRAWYMATAAVVVLVLLAGWFLLISPRNSSAGDARAQTETADGTATTLLSQLSQLRTQAAGLVSEQQRLRVFEQKVPATVAMPTLIRALNGAAVASEADLLSLTPGLPVLPTSTASAAAPSSSPATPGPTPATPIASPATGVAAPGSAAGSGAAPYSVVPLTFTVTGTYFVLQRFFTAIEALPRSLTLTSVALTPLDATAAVSTTGSPVLTAALTGSAYVSALPPVPPVSAPGVPSPALTPTPTAK